jgi:hypothetical protein
MRIRQIALVAKEMNPVKDVLFELLGVNDAYMDPKISKFGLENIVMSLGDTFLEVVCPIEAGTTAGRLLERRGGDGGYMVIVQVNDLALEKSRLAQTTIRTVWEVDIGHAKAIHLHPRDVPGAIASLDQMEPVEAWYWAGGGWADRKAKHAGNITGAEIQSDDPPDTANKWALAYGANNHGVATAPKIDFGSSEVRFVKQQDGRGNGLRAIDVEATNMDLIITTAEKLGLRRDGTCIQVCGTAINFI